MYKCCKCGRSINVGDKYFEFAGAEPWETVDVCPKCISKMDKDELIEMFNFDRDDLLDMIDELACYRTI